MHSANRRYTTSALLLGLLAAFSGCSDSPTGPRPLGAGVLAVGAVAEGTIASTADTARFSLVLTDGRDAMVYLMAKGAYLRLEVRDSTGKLVAATIDAYNTTRPEERATAIIPASRFRYYVTVAMMDGGTAPSDYEIRVVAASSAPEHVSPTLTVGAIVSGEDLDHAFDVDSFAISVDHDELVNLYLRKTIHSASVVTARVFAAGLYTYPGGTSAGEADTVLGAVGSSRFTLSAGVSYTIRVYYDTPDTARTPYELQLRRIDTAPESAPSALVTGDTIDESIDYLGDLDEFTLTGAPGAKFNLFADAGGDPPHAITAQLIAVDASEPSISASAGGLTLAANATGVFTLPSNGMLTVRVSDGDGWGRGHVGPYRLFVYPIDTRVEGTSSALTLDQVTSSRIDMLGDVDEFTLAIGETAPVNIEVRRPDDAAGRPLRFILLTPGDSEITRGMLGVGYPAVDTTALGTHWMTPGTYTLRIEPAASQSGGFAGSYEIVPRVIAAAPEHGAGTITIGDTLRSERLDIPGDVDRFHLSLDAGDSVYVALGGLPDGVAAKAHLYRTSDGTLMGGAGASGSVDGQSRIVTITAAGDYYIEVSGQTAGVLQTETGPYELAIDRVTAAPESGPSTVALGDTVAGRLEVPGDVDQFTLAAPSGTEITGWFHDSTGYGYCCIAVEFIDPATGAVLRQSTANAQGVGRITVPVGGSLRLRVREPYSCDSFGCYGPNVRTSYRLWLTAVNRAPESRPAAFAIGDTVSGEWIDPVGDVDEFTFDGAAGDTVNVYFQTPMGTWGYEGLTMALLDRTTGATLGTLTSNNPTANLEDIALTRVVLPTSGSYMIRVVGTNASDNKGTYRFRVARPGQ